MASVKCVAPWPLGVPALGREVEPGEVVEVSDEQWAGLVNQVGVWESVEAPEGWARDETAGVWSVPTPPAADLPPASTPPVADQPPASAAPKARGRGATDSNSDNSGEGNPDGAAI
jgi:hypothetical protein